MHKGYSPAYRSTPMIMLSRVHTARKPSGQPRPLITGTVFSISEMGRCCCASTSGSEGLVGRLAVSISCSLGADMAHLCIRGGCNNWVRSDGEPNM